MIGDIEDSKIQWKTVVGYDKYRISTNGDIFSLYRNKILIQTKDKDGYCYVTIVKDKIKKNMRIHRLVAMTFLENPENKPTVNHINGIKNDNRLENLEWATLSEQE